MNEGKRQIPLLRTGERKWFKRLTLSPILSCKFLKTVGVMQLRMEEKEGRGKPRWDGKDELSKERLSFTHDQCL